MPANEVTQSANDTQCANEVTQSADNSKKVIPKPQVEKKEKLELLPDGSRTVLPEETEECEESTVSETYTNDLGDLFMDILRAGATNKKHKESSVSDEHINKLIKAAFEKYKEEQKPKDTVQENIQKDFEKVDCVQKALDPTAAVRQNIQDDKKHD